MTMDTEATASLSRLTLLSNFGPPPPPSAKVDKANGHTISQSASIHSAMSIETNEDDDDQQRDTARQSNGSDTTRRNGNCNDRKRGSACEIYEEDQEDGVYSRRRNIPSLSAEESRKAVVHIEARLIPRSMMRFGVIQNLISTYIHENFDRLEVGAELEGWREVQTLANSVDRLCVTESSSPDAFPEVAKCRIVVHVYQPSARNIIDEFAATTGGMFNPATFDEDDDETTVMAATVRELPSRDMDGLWDSLIYPDDVKPKLLNYIYTTLLFSDANVDFNIVTWNRVVLLHGPPGTGKTSLCRALAQKLAIRLSNRYSHGRLVEINSHSLFSKWFSESGKLVQKLFARVTEMVEDESGFVVVLIDEVESLTAARAGAMSGTEPSDALRVVNALLTQLDKLKHRKNVLVMSTSNIAQAIGKSHSAFIDRADIKQYIGLPPPQAVYWILSGCLTELMRAGIIAHLDLLEWKDLQVVKTKPSQKPERERIRQACLKIAAISEACQGMSGRSLRRLPVLAHARHIGINTTDEMHQSPVEDWIEAMQKVVGEEGEQMNRLDEAVGTGKI
ncbi:hypothetical protein NliqN6_5642 [Naganishia liquefaciens]|uniref:AAA+ ATPase domain-containing protein n=1 Tax=Naganishia liquefaciens TaxID=104408 RepID=A0A8H3TXX1_9TREE|nr:hypothetical protein NliqN6_5642 [Naganishia liquefaciens]